MILSNSISKGGGSYATICNKTLAWDSEAPVEDRTVKICMEHPMALNYQDPFSLLTSEVIDLHFDLHFDLYPENMKNGVFPCYFHSNP